VSRILVPLSGGIDSATLLALTVSQGFPAECLFVDYGQPNRRERPAARDLARHYHARLHETRVSLPWRWDCAAERLGYVPARNMLILSLASSLAEAMGYRQIRFGAQAGDLEDYPDCTYDFLRAFNELAHAGLHGQVAVVAPFIHTAKDGVVSRARELGVPLHLTTSCLRSGDEECGTCLSCEARRKAGAPVAGWTDE